MYLDSYVNQNIQIKFKNLPEDLTGPMTGIYKPDDWYTVKLIQAENMGIWVENPCYKRTVVEDDGTEIPIQEQKEETCTTNFMIRWEHISSVITFPNATKNVVDKDTMLIGFHA